MKYLVRENNIRNIYQSVLDIINKYMRISYVFCHVSLAPWRGARENRRGQNVAIGIVAPRRRAAREMACRASGIARRSHRGVARKARHAGAPALHLLHVSRLKRTHKQAWQSEISSSCTRLRVKSASMLASEISSSRHPRTALAVASAVLLYDK